MAGDTRVRIVIVGGSDVGISAALRIRELIPGIRSLVIGENVCGLDTEFQGTLGTQSIKLWDMVIARTGLDDREASANGFDPLTVEIEAWDHKVYYPPAYKTRVRFTADRKTRRILGGQILGHIEAEISKRIDILVGTVHQNLTVEDFNQWDISYTPPLSSPWDPVQAAAQEWMRRAAG